MNKELIAALEALEKEKGISKEIMFDTIESALLEEVKAQYSIADNCRVEVNRETGVYHIFLDMTATEDEIPPVKQIFGRHIVLVGIAAIIRESSCSCQ